MCDRDPRQQPVQYPPAKYSPGDYPDGYYADPSPREHSQSRYSPHSRMRSDSGIAAGPPPRQSMYPEPQLYSSAPPSQSYFTYTPNHQHWYQPPPERADDTLYGFPQAGAQAPRANLHPEDAYQPRSEAYPTQRRGRSRSDVDYHRAPAPCSPYYSDDDEERRAENRRERRRRRSEGAYSDSESQRRRERRKRRSSKSSYEEKRPTLAESAIWAYSKAKKYVTSPY